MTQDKEFNLSEKIEDLTGGNAIDFYENVDEAIDVNDIKEFIKRKDDLDFLLFKGRITWQQHKRKKDKLAGKNFV